MILFENKIERNTSRHTPLPLCFLSKVYYPQQAADFFCSGWVDVGLDGWMGLEEDG